MMALVVGDLFRGFGRKREDASPIEPLDSESICARVGGPKQPCAPAGDGPEPASYIRVDAPQPAPPRNWRAGPQESAR